MSQTTDVTRMLHGPATYGASTASARALGTLAALLAQRESKVRACVVGFWICLWIAVLGLLMMTRAPPGPFKPEPFGVAKAFLRKCGASLR